MEAGILARLEHGLAKEGSCAVLIQTKYRGKLEHRNIVKAAIKVQAAGRGSKVRRDLGAAKEKLRAELEELEELEKSGAEAEGSAPKRTKSQERGRAEEEEEEEGGGEAIALRHQRPDPDVEPAELQRQLKLYVTQLEKQERTLKKEIEKIKRERPYLNATDQRGNTEKRRAAQRKLEEVAVELRAQRELQHEIRATEKVQGHLIGKRPVNSTRATALERFETRLGAMQRRWRRRQARLLLAPKLTKVCLRLRTEPAPPVSLTLRATGDEQPCAVRVWAAFAPPSKKKDAASSAHAVVAAALHVRREAVEEEEEEEGGEEGEEGEEAHLGGGGKAFSRKKRGALHGPHLPLPLTLPLTLSLTLSLSLSLTLPLNLIRTRTRTRTCTLTLTLTLALTLTLTLTFHPHLSPSPFTLTSTLARSTTAAAEPSQTSPRTTSS